MRPHFYASDTTPFRPGRCHGCARGKRHSRSLSYATSTVLQRKCTKRVTPLVLDTRAHRHIDLEGRCRNCYWERKLWLRPQYSAPRRCHTELCAMCRTAHCCAQRRRQTSNTSNNRRWNVQRRRQSSTGHTQPQTMRTRNRNSSPNPRIHSRRGGVPARNCWAKKISL